MIICDVWGGPNSMNHLARYILPVEDALPWAERELDGGYLVNLRKDHAWGEYQTFDIRAVMEKLQ